MELHQLRYFCAVAETGSFSLAAEQSHVSQPSLSQQILKLEDELGARLFDRLRFGTIDVALLPIPIRGREFDAFPLLTERLYAALPKKHRLSSRRSLSLQALRAEPFLLLRDAH